MFNLTELLIANRVRNSEKMSDNDIYQIYRDTFKNITKVFEKPQRKNFANSLETKNKRVLEEVLFSCKNISQDINYTL